MSQYPLVCPDIQATLQERVLAAPRYPSEIAQSEAHSHKGCRGWSLDVVVVALLATLSRTHCVTPSGTQRATLSGTDDQALSVTDSAQDAYSYR